MIDDNIIDSKLWPRATALAERVWNPSNNRTKPELVLILGAMNNAFMAYGLRP